MTSKKKARVRLGSYARLSRDDENDGVSNSIVNQQQIIRQYCERSTEDLVVAREYADDGYSGTTFERPGWQRLYADLEEGAIDGFIVKDSSRFCRNFVEGGMMLQKVFPRMRGGRGVRVIMVNDSYDSASSDPYASSVMMAFKGLFNDNVSRDTSMKTRTGLHAKMRRGEFCGAWAPYGYLKDPERRGHLVPDPGSAPVVRGIFEAFLNGAPMAAISRDLNARGVPCPSEYRREQGGNLQSPFPTSERPQWHAGAVARVLSNEVYAGTLVQGRTYTPSFRSKKTLPRPEAEQFRAENAHEPLVSPHGFALARDMMRRDTRTSPGSDVLQIFSGMVYCADCGELMSTRTGRNGNRYLVCSTNRRDRTACSSHMVNAAKIEAAVHDASDALVRSCIEMDSFVEHNRQTVVESRTRDIDRQIDEAASRQERALAFRHGLADDLAAGVINEEEYALFSDGYAKRIEDARNAIGQLRKRREEAASEVGRAEAELARVAETPGIGELTRRAVVELVERIEVAADKSVHIRFRVDDVLEALGSAQKEAAL